MVGSRTATAAVGVALSLAVSVAVWWAFDVLFAFLLVPFVPFLFARRGDEGRDAGRECPACGFRTADPRFDYCPRDGTRLEEAGDSRTVEERR